MIRRDVTQGQEGHRRGSSHRKGQCSCRPGLVAVGPAHHRSDAHHRGCRRRKGHGVVGVEDARHETEHHCRGEQPPHPHQNRSTLQVAARGAGPPDQQSHTEDQCCRQQPTDSTDLFRLEQPADSGLTPGVLRGPAAEVDRRTDTEGSHAAGLIAVEASDSVVVQGQFKDRVVLGSTDPRSPVGRPQLNQQHPPTGSGQRGAQGEQQAPHPVQCRPRAGHQIAECQRGHHQCHLELLGQITQPDADATEYQPPEPAVLDRP